MLLSHHHSICHTHSKNKARPPATAFIAIQNTHKPSVMSSLSAKKENSLASATHDTAYGENSARKQPVLDTQKLLLVQQLLDQLQQSWLEIDIGINKAYAIWDGLLSNDDQCAMLLSGGTSSVDFIMDDLETGPSSHQQSLPVDYHLFCSQLTALIHIENSILNVIENYQFCVEQYCRLNSNSNNNNHDKNSVNSYNINNINNNNRRLSRQHSRSEMGSPIAATKKTFARSDFDDVGEYKVQKREPFSRQKALNELQVNNHIDRLCSCAQIFGRLRRILIVDDIDLFCEFKALFLDVEAITGHSPNRTRNSLAQNHVCMLEKAYHKFQRKMREYERLVAALSVM